MHDSIHFPLIGSITGKTYRPHVFLEVATQFFFSTVSKREGRGREVFNCDI